MLKMATKKTKPPKIFDINKMLKDTVAEVTLYDEIIDQLSVLFEAHPSVSQDFIAHTLLDKYQVTMEWFLVMQEYHKQSVRDKIRGKL